MGWGWISFVFGTAIIAGAGLFCGAFAFYALSELAGKLGAVTIGKLRGKSKPARVGEE